MITYSGVHIQTIGGDAGTPTAMDIAVHAGRICRFGGAVWYPLLPHLVFVGLLAYRRSGSLMNAVWGFLHDAHEVVTCDVPRPFKCDCMRREQSALDERIIKRFVGAATIDTDLIKRCDLDACDMEAITLGLPGYREVKASAVDSYRAYQSGVHEDAADVAILHRILKSPFYKNTTWENSEGVWMFARMLSHAEQRDWDALKTVIEAW
jgi:hypothetical protein